MSAPFCQVDRSGAFNFPIPPANVISALIDEALTVQDCMGLRPLVISARLSVANVPYLSVSNRTNRCFRPEVENRVNHEVNSGTPGKADFRPWGVSAFLLPRQP